MTHSILSKFPCCMGCEFWAYKQWPSQDHWPQSRKSSIAGKEAVRTSFQPHIQAGLVKPWSGFELGYVSSDCSWDGLEQFCSNLLGQAACFEIYSSSIRWKTATIITVFPLSNIDLLFFCWAHIDLLSTIIRVDIQMHIFGILYNYYLFHPLTLCVVIAAGIGVAMLFS